MLAGLAAMVVGYLGTSRTVLVAGQIPYVVSGGLIGLALVFLGGFLYFGYWLALLVRDGRRQAAELARDQELLRAELSELRGALADLTRTLTPSARRARGGRA